MNDNTNLYNKIASYISLEIIKYTPQLYYVEDHSSDEAPYPHSSSVLLHFDEKFFLVTAGHCVHNIDLTKVGIMLGHDFCSIGGSLKCYEPNDEDTYEPTNLDLAIFRLKSETVDAFKEKYDFLNVEKLNFNHISSKESRYLIFGYPGELTENDDEAKVIIPSSLKLRTIGVPFLYYLQEGIDKNKTLVLFVDQNNIGTSDSTTVSELAALGGISGCGVWHVSDLNTSNPQYQLVSILTGENQEQTTLYSTKIDIIPYFLKRDFNLTIYSTTANIDLKK